MCALRNGSTSDNPQPSVCLITLGCAKNEVDSSLMEENLVNAGYAVTADPENADCIIVNTCCFIQEATEESLDTIFDLDAHMEQTGRRKPLIIAGCLPARYGDALASELTEASCFLPCNQEGNAVSAVEALIGAPISTNRLPQDPLCMRSVENVGVSRYVKISDGCDRFCSYCAIPYIRGRYRSFPLESIVERIDHEVRTGAREIVLIAQDTGRWGTDFEQPSSLSALLAHCATRYPEVWLRVLYTEPEGVTDELIETVASFDNICSYFDIPLQHVDPVILKAMNRTGSAGEFLSLFRKIRAAIPSATLRTTFIAGFPGESADQSDEILDFLEEADLDYVGVFPFSAEEGTRAASLPDQIDEEERIERAQSIRDFADSISCARISDRIGSTHDIIIEGVEEDGQLYGRAQCQAPEIDGVTYIDGGTVGERVCVTIEDTLFYEMEGSVVHCG